MHSAQMGTSIVHMDTKPQDIAFNLAGVISEKLSAAGKSVLHMAQKTGIPRTTLHRRLSTGAGLEVAEVAAIASYLDTTPEDLIAEAENRRSSHMKATA